MDQLLKPLHLVCVMDEMRTNFALIEIRNGIAQATNGHILVRIDLRNAETETKLSLSDIETLNGKYIHMNVWKEIYKCDLLELDNYGIYCHKDGIKKTFEYSQPQGTFFDIGTIVTEVIEGGEEDKRIMTYSPKLISIIDKVFQSPQLHFSFSKGHNGTLVYPSYGGGMFAVLMPLMSDGVNRYYFAEQSKVKVTRSETGVTIEGEANAIMEAIDKASKKLKSGN